MVPGNTSYADAVKVRSEASAKESKPKSEPKKSESKKNELREE